jgi:hypothetical protein
MREKGGDFSGEIPSGDMGIFQLEMKHRLFRTWYHVIKHEND